MFNKRLISTVPQSRKYIAANVLCQLISLAASMITVYAIADYIQKLWNNAELHSQAASGSDIMLLVVVVLAALAVRAVCLMLTSKTGFLSSKAVKLTLRQLITEKLLRLGRGYSQQTASSEIVQLAGEGVDQLETYFGAYLPQFFYAMLAPLCLFGAMCFISVKTAVILLVCVPLIPVSIVAVQKIAKKLLSAYWGQYARLGDSFLESLQGLTTLKIYNTDDRMHEKINTESENFRRVTMKVLTMQLNSVTVMDIFAYGGAAAGIIMAAVELSQGNIGLSGCVVIILLSAEFFLPMRKLGSFFHIAMNGMAACDKIFRLLDLPEDNAGTKSAGSGDIEINGLHYSYNEEREILSGIDMSFPKQGFYGIVGESGCGKSTIAGILSGKNRGYGGSVKIGGEELSDISPESLMQTVTLISHNSYIFSGTVRENLIAGKSDISDERLWDALDRVRLADFFRAENGLDTIIAERASNLSGGQRQRLALARGILHDSAVYIFDESTSNIDSESEECIVSEILRMAQEKCVIMISHRLANIHSAARIYVLENGLIAENGNHEQLIGSDGLYSRLHRAQSELEQLGGAV